MLEFLIHTFLNLTFLFYFDVSSTRILFRVSYKLQETFNRMDQSSEINSEYGLSDYRRIYNLLKSEHNNDNTLLCFHLVVNFIYSCSPSCSPTNL